MPRRPQRELGWRPQTTFAALVRLMLEADLREAGLDDIADRVGGS